MRGGASSDRGLISQPALGPDAHCAEGRAGAPLGRARVRPAARRGLQGWTAPAGLEAPSRPVAAQLKIPRPTGGLPPPCCSMASRERRHPGPFCRPLGLPSDLTVYGELPPAESAGLDAVCCRNRTPPTSRHPARTAGAAGVTASMSGSLGTRMHPQPPLQSPQDPGPSPPPSSSPVPSLPGRAPPDPQIFRARSGGVDVESFVLSSVSKILWQGKEVEPRLWRQLSLIMAAALVQESLAPRGGTTRGQSSAPNAVLSTVPGAGELTDIRLEPPSPLLCVPLILGRPYVVVSCQQEGCSRQRCHIVKHRKPLQGRKIESEKSRDATQYKPCMYSLTMQRPHSNAASFISRFLPATDAGIAKIALKMSVHTSSPLLKKNH